MSSGMIGSSCVMLCSYVWSGSVAVSEVLAVAVFGLSVAAVASAVAPTAVVLSHVGI